MAQFDFTRTRGYNLTPEAASALGRLLAGTDWSGPYEDWTVQADGSLRAAVASADLSKSLQLWLEGWRMSPSGNYQASELLFAFTQGLNSGTLNQASARYTGNLSVKPNLSSITGTVTQVEENQNNQEYAYWTGSWDMSKFMNPDPAQVFYSITSGNDTIIGSPYNDTLNGGNGNDTIRGNSGDDIIYGGEGFDTAGFGHQFSSYRIGTNAQGAVTVTDLTAGREGTSTLYGIEALSFTDRTVSVSEVLAPTSPSPGSGSGSGSTPPQESGINQALVASMVSGAWLHPSEVSSDSNVTYYIDKKGTYRFVKSLQGKGKSGGTSPAEASFIRDFFGQVDAAIPASVTEVTSARKADIVIGAVYGKTKVNTAQAFNLPKGTEVAWKDRGGNKLTIGEKFYIGYGIASSFGLDITPAEYSTLDSIMGARMDGYHGLTANDRAALGQLWAV